MSHTAPRRFQLLMIALASLLARSSPTPTAGPLPPAEEGLARWRAERETNLRSESGWLTLVGLFWLGPGENRVGSAPNCAVRLAAPLVPPDSGALILEGGHVKIRPRAGSGITLGGGAVGERILSSDADGEPDVLRLGRLSFYIVKRGDRFGVRVKDPGAPARVHFHGLSYFPSDPAHRVEARFVPFDPPRSVSIPTAVGTTETQRVAGRLDFVLKGRKLSLLPFEDEKAPGPLFIVFSDETSGKTTYGAGRFLDADPPKNGVVILDFDRAYNPPCAFTPFATCPLPPRENRLRIAIEAGEKKYGDH